MQLPAIPPWEGLHPIVVHFPIALLLVAPLFVVVSMVWRSRSREMLLAATLLVALGAGGAALSVATGEAGEAAAERIAKAALHEHEELAERARNLFLGLSAVFVVLLAVVWRRAEPLAARGRLALGAVLLGLYAFPALTLANAAHAGGRLVHEFGVRAPMSKATERPLGATRDED